MINNSDVRPTVLIYLEPNSFASKQTQIFTGILRYEQFHTPWNIEMFIYSYRKPVDIDFRRISGFIGDEYTKLIYKIASHNIPSVLIDPSPKLMGELKNYKRYCIVKDDGLKTGKMGADYFLERNYKYFAYVNTQNSSLEKPTLYWSQCRQKGFEDQLLKNGKKCYVYHSTIHNLAEDECQLSKWLIALPKPVAVMAAWDGRANQIIRICAKNRISIPNEVAVLGVDDNEFICRISTPALSSVRTDNITAGYKAGEFLDGLMQRQIRKPRVYHYTPLNAVTRQSTNANCFDDPIVSEAMAYIWDMHGCRVTVGDLVRKLNVSARNLEYRFKTIIGRTPKEEIDRICLSYICNLLNDSKLTIAEISDLSGFCDRMYLSKFFKKHTGITMCEFRDREFLKRDNHVELE